MMTVSRMCSGDVVVAVERLTYAYCHRLLAYIKMCQSGHERLGIEFVHAFLELANLDHLLVHLQPQFDIRSCLRSPGTACRWCHCHAVTPESFAKSMKSDAKSFSANPILRACVKYSFVTVVVGSGK